MNNRISNQIQKTRHKLFYSLISVLLISVSSCSFDEPVAPKWDVTLDVPLANRILTMQELIDKNDFLVADTAGLVSLDINEDLDRFEVGDELSVNDIQETFASKMGEFHVPSPNPQSVSLNFAELYPPSILLDNQQAPVPQFTFDNLSIDLPDFDSFQSVSLKSGFLQVTVTNRLQIPVAVQLHVLNRETEEEIVIASFDPEIAPGIESTKTIDLSGKTIPAALKLALSGSSSGSQGVPISVHSFIDGIDIEVRVTDIVADEAVAIVEEQDFVGSDSLALGDSIIVTRGQIASGYFQIEVENYIPLDMRFELQLNDFYDYANQPLVLSVPMISGERTSRIVNISNYEFRPSRTPEGSVVTFNWIIHVNGSGGEFIHFSSEDSVHLDVNLMKMEFSEIQGILKDIQVDIDPYSESVDMPNGMDDFEFESAQLELKFNNGIGFPIYPNLKIEGLNESTGKQVDLLVNEAIAPANGHPVESSIILNETNSQLIEFLNISPNQLNVSGTVTVGDGISESVIRNTDFVESSVHITAPLSLSFASQSIKTEADTIEIDQDAQDELKDNILSGKLYAQIANHLPFGFQVSLYFNGQDTSVFNHPELTIGPLDLDPAVVSTSSGKVEQETSSEIDVELTQEQIALFAHDEVYFGVSADIPGTNNQVYRVYADDYIHVKAYGEFKYHVDPEKMSE